MVPARLLRMLRRIGVESTIADPAQLTHNYICMYIYYTYTYTCMCVCVCRTRQRACASWRINVSLGIKVVSSQSHFVCLYICAIRNQRCLLIKAAHTHTHTRTPAASLRASADAASLELKSFRTFRYAPIQHVCMCACVCINTYNAMLYPKSAYVYVCVCINICYGRRGRACAPCCLPSDTASVCVCVCVRACVCVCVQVVEEEGDLLASIRYCVRHGLNGRGNHNGGRARGVGLDVGH